METDCKSVGVCLRRFESCTCHQCDVPRTSRTAAREVARNRSASQAFVLRRSLAVQFHPELTSNMLAGWLGNGGADKATAAGLDPDILLGATRAAEADARLRAHRLVDGFLDIVSRRPVSGTALS